MKKKCFHLVFFFFFCSGGAWPQWPGRAADVRAALGAEHGGDLGDGAVAAAPLHAGAHLPAPRGIQGGVSV